MGRTCRIALLAFLAAGSAGSALAQQALPDAVEVQNNRTAPIEELRVSPDFESSWGANRLRALTIPPGEKAKIPTQDLRGGCYFDVRVREANGSESEYWSLNLCNQPLIKLD